MAPDSIKRDARAEFERIRAAIARNPRDPSTWCELAELYLALDEPAQAQQACMRALTVSPGHPLALTLDAAAALALDDLEGAERSARLALASSGAPETAWRVLGDALFALGRAREAADALARAPVDAESAYNLGLALDDAGDVVAARDAFDRALALDPTMHAAAAQLAHVKRRLGEWPGLDALNARLRAAVRADEPGVTPFAFLAESGDPAAQRRCAELFAATFGATAPKVARRASSRPRVAFVSSGFNNHPTGLLTVELFERLRGGRLETHAFATTASDGGALRARLERAVDGFHDASRLPHAALAQAIRARNIDILVDLRGYGGGSAAAALALRPAPVQVNWLAYPGTSGAPWIDFLIGDEYVTPRGSEAHYSETLLRMPHAFQPCDTTRAILAPPSRVECGLPARGAVFASFNNGYKITPDVLDAWARILVARLDSVLWLLEPSDGGVFAANLRREAEARGVAPARLVFMPKLPHEQYLARYAHVDLFLDSWPYGAHTTASDALFAGCPVLTLPGESFASRVAGSLLTTLARPDLICASVGDYVTRAVALEVPRVERRPELFDMAGFARDFEALILAL